MARGRRAGGDGLAAALPARGRGRVRRPRRHRPHAVRDTILIGELAPEGPPAGRAADRHHRDRAAQFPAHPVLPGLELPPAPGGRCGVAALPAARDFVRANPALFQASGFAHHPYFFFRPPATPTTDPDWAALADLGRLEHAIDRALGAYGVNRRLPLYLTEYGYETNPPNPFRGRQSHPPVAVPRPG